MVSINYLMYNIIYWRYYLRRNCCALEPFRNHQELQIGESKRINTI